MKTSFALRSNNNRYNYKRLNKYIETGDENT